MRRSIFGAVLCSLCIVAAGCGGPDSKKPASVSVAGTVQVDGKPLDDGEITLTSAGFPANIPIKAGKFSGKAMVGENDVQVYGFKTTKPIMMGDTAVGEPVKENYVDDKFNVNSKLKAKVPAGGVSDLKFEVEAKK